MNPKVTKLFALVLAACALFAVGAANAGAFAIVKVDGSTVDEAGETDTQAGAHPFAFTTEIQFSEVTNGGGQKIPDGNFKNLKALLPPGLIGNPQAIRQCTLAEFQDMEFAGENGKCPDEAAIGVASVLETSETSQIAPVYNLQPNPGEPALFGFHIATTSVFLHPNARTGGDYGITVSFADLSQALPLVGTTLTLWGVPADEGHDGERGSCLFTGGTCESTDDPAPFLSMPTSCTGPMRTEVQADSWQEQGVFKTGSFLSHDNAGNPVGNTGCDQLEFEPTFDVAATDGNADSPTGFEIGIHVPQNEVFDELATSHLKKAAVTLPAGTTVNSAAANGIATCSEAQFGPKTADRPACPEGSRIGEVEIVSPIQDNPLQGGVFLAEQGRNPFGSVLAIYLEAEADGALIKLAGKVEGDPQTGQVTTTFDDNPQLPFSDIAVNLFGGNAGVLTLPNSCGTHTATAVLSPWSGTTPVTRQSSFAVNAGPDGKACPNNGFAPRFSAGMINPGARQYSPFVLQLTRDDGTQRLTGVDVTLPNGLLANLSDIPYCADAALAAIPTGAGNGAAQASTPSCPAASRVGSASVQSGTGPSPVFVDTGRVYLAGPYKGAPLSLAVVAPALAGPFDLGNVVVRVALRVNPETAQVEAISDPIPTVLAGVPLNLRDLRVNLDRPRFTVNPSNCTESAVSGAIAGSGGATAAVSSRFGVTGCDGLAFKPKLALKLKGGTKRNSYPALTATIGYRPANANLAAVSVALPRSEFLAQNHIRTVCTRVQFAAGAVPGAGCPKGSVYGFAKATTPLLGAPLEGPVYLRSSSNKLPDLVLALHGQIDIVLAGRIDSFKKGIRTTFPTIPDAPISSFTLSLKGGKKSLLVNSRDLCKGKNRATVKLAGQNGATANSTPAVANSCKKKKR